MLLCGVEFAIKILTCLFVTPYICFRGMLDKSNELDKI